jgi:predicted phosphodiesterase
MTGDCQQTSPENKAWLRELPREIRLEVEGWRVLLCHGSPRSTTEYLFETRSEGYLKQFTPGGKDDAHADVVVFGHTHVPYHRSVNGVDFVNTVSIGSSALLVKTAFWLPDMVFLSVGRNHACYPFTKSAEEPR